MAFAVAALVLAGAGLAAAECPQDPGDAPARDRAPCSAPVAEQAPDPDVPEIVAAGRERGEKELVLARKALDDGERATDDPSRKQAYETAKQHADRAVELLPESAEARFVQFGADGRLAQMGGVAVAAMNLVKLNKQLDEVLRLDPNHANALAARGGMLMKLPRLLGGDTSEGVEYLERSVAMDPTAVGKRLELAEAYHIVGREQDAEQTANAALETARQMNDPNRVQTCERFISALKEACSGCAVALIGR
jgi:tetratricopeptide (TPR) repeat protein